jgi:hypothetical protein
MDSETRLERIKNKINHLKSFDKDFQLFGSNIHEYRFNNKLTTEEIIVFEKENDLKLPKDYSAFLKNIGNGGAGPFYGLFPLILNDPDSDEGLPPSKPFLEFPYDRKNPCNLSKVKKLVDFNKELDNLHDNKKKGIEPNNFTKEDIICEKKEEILNKIYEKAIRGIIYLSHEGCGMYNILIINGKEKGNVWFFDFADGGGVFPLIDSNNQPMKFFDWYEFWLDKAITSIGKDDDFRYSIKALQNYIKYE